MFRLYRSREQHSKDFTTRKTRKTSTRRAERAGAVPVKIRPVGWYWYYDLKTGESGIYDQPEYVSAYPKSMLDEQKCRCAGESFDPDVPRPVVGHSKLGAR